MAWDGGGGPGSRVSLELGPCLCALATERTEDLEMAWSTEAWVAVGRGFSLRRGLTNWAAMSITHTYA